MPSADQALKRSKANAAGFGTGDKAAALDSFRQKDGDHRYRKATAEPGGSQRPAADYSPARGHDEKRGDGRGRAEKCAVVKGQGWGDGGPARRDASFYAKKRAWEASNGRKISTPEFRQKYWDGAV